MNFIQKNYSSKFQPTLEPIIFHTICEITLLYTCTSVQFAPRYKKYEGMNVKIYGFLTSVLDGGD